MVLDDRDEFGGGFTLAEVTRLVDRMEFIIATEAEGTPRYKTYRRVLDTMKRLKADLEVVA